MTRVRVHDDLGYGLLKELVETNKNMLSKLHDLTEGIRVYNTASDPLWVFMEGFVPVPPLIVRQDRPFDVRLTGTEVTVPVTPTRVTDVRLVASTVTQRVEAESLDVNVVSSEVVLPVGVRGAVDVKLPEVLPVRLQEPGACQDVCILRAPRLEVELGGPVRLEPDVLPVRLAEPGACQDVAVLRAPKVEVELTAPVPLREPVLVKNTMAAEATHGPST